MAVVELESFMGAVLTQSKSVAETVELMQAAVEVNQRCQQRIGNVIALTPEVADDIVITADLHGHRQNFQKIVDIAALKQHPHRHLVLQEVCHGGPSDEEGGCQSHLMLREVAELVVEFPGRVHFLLSNHELSEVIDYPIMKNGAVLTIAFRMGISHTYGPDWEQVFQAYKEFIASSPLAIVLSSDIFISHSVPERVLETGFDTTIFHRQLKRPDLQMEGPVGQLVWGRDYRPENLKAFRRIVRAQVLINGHTPCETGFVTREQTQIILDCCDENATYLHLPLRYSYRFNDIVARIAKL